jgi:nucleotide-binding universal stress UspA family protein
MHGLATMTPTLVCGTDFTEIAHDVVDLAAMLAGAFGARLHVVHVADTSGPAWRDEAVRGRAIGAARGALEDEAARLAATHAVPITASVRTGSPGRELAAAADELGATMIVVAAIGPTPSIFRIGGTAERVAQAARVPILVVRDPAPLRGWLNGQRLAIAAAITEDAASDHAIEWLRALRRVAACDVAVLTAYYVDDATRRFGLTPRPLVVADPEIEGYLRRDLEQRIGDLGGRGAVTLHPLLAHGRLADHLVEHPAARQAGLLVVGNHRARGLARLSSVASGVLHLAASSVLIVPVDAPSIAPAPWPRIRRVLAATDFSDLATAAIRHAYGLVAAGGGEVTLLHVMTGASSDATVQESLDQLRPLVPPRPPHGVVSSIEAIWQRSAAVGIVEVAARIGADVIVIASHGRSGLRKVLLGSVAHGVIERSHRPVLIVRPPADLG